MEQPNYIKMAIEEGKFIGLKWALDLARIQKEYDGDLDYLIANLEEILKKK